MIEGTDFLALVFNSLPTSVRDSTEFLLAQVMVWRLASDKPLPEPIMAYCQQETLEQFSINFESKIKISIFYFKNINLKNTVCIISFILLRSQYVEFC